jgi:2-polyprenyl-6-methoxyphenol hydroxylase-like FAD-dependent oxidoreductase
MEADVTIVGAGPTGLMLAAELRLARVRTLVLERRPEIRETPRAGAFVGRIVDLLRYRGLLGRIEAASGIPSFRAPKVPFGNLYLDFSQLAEAPIWGARLPQPQLERLLEEHARELGAEIRRGHELVGLRQHDASVTVEVHGSDGPYRLETRYLVGCDGSRSRVRVLAGIAFPGTTYPEVNRLGTTTVHHSVIRLDNGDIVVPGLGLVRAGFTRTARGVFALGSLDPAVLGIQTTEDEQTAVDDDAPMTRTEFRDSIRRVLGGDIPLGEVTRLSRYGFEARQAELYRNGRILVAGDAAHQFPATGIGINVGMLDAVNLGWKLAAAAQGWAPAGLLDTYHDERHFAGARGMMQTQAQAALRREQDPAMEALRELLQELMVYDQPLRHMGELIAATDIRYSPTNPNGRALTGTFVPDLILHTDQGATSVAALMRTARPILLDLADRSELRSTARDWQHRIDIHTTKTDDRPADALLIRPDAHIGWAATIDEPAATATVALREALLRWFGSPETKRVLSETV